MNDYRYDHQTVQGFILSAIAWGVVGILVGLLISIQLWAPAANFAPYLTYKAITFMGFDMYHAMSAEQEATSALNRDANGCR